MSSRRRYGAVWLSAMGSGATTVAVSIAIPISLADAAAAQFLTLYAAVQIFLNLFASVTESEHISQAAPHSYRFWSAIAPPAVAVLGGTAAIWAISGTTAATIFAGCATASIVWALRRVELVVSGRILAPYASTATRDLIILGLLISLGVSGLWIIGAGIGAMVVVTSIASRRESRLPVGADRRIWIGQAIVLALPFGQRIIAQWRLDPSAVVDFDHAVRIGGVLLSTILAGVGTELQRRLSATNKDAIMRTTATLSVALVGAAGLAAAVVAGLWYTGMGSERYAIDLNSALGILAYSIGGVFALLQRATHALGDRTSFAFASIVASAVGLTASVFLAEMGVYGLLAAFVLAQTAGCLALAIRYTMSDRSRPSLSAESA